MILTFLPGPIYLYPPHFVRAHEVKSGQVAQYLDPVADNIAKIVVKFNWIVLDLILS
jgi:hypothetical protein